VAGGGGHRDGAADGRAGGRGGDCRGRRGGVVVHRDRHGRGGRRIAGGVAGAGCEAVATVAGRRRGPAPGVRRSRVGGLHHAVEEELDLGDADVVAGGGGHRDGAADGRASGRRGDRRGRRGGVVVHRDRHG